MMIQKKYNLALLLTAVLMTSACTQTTPSMMNTQPLTVSEESVIDQVPLSAINDSTLKSVAQYYLKDGSGPLDLTMTYNPHSKSFGKSQANHKLGHIVSDLKKKGVKSVLTNTMAVPNTEPMLVITYDSLIVNAPADCGHTPGLDGYQTGRFIGEYKFGCGVEKLFAKQVADPSDLYGKSTMSARDARREVGVIEGYSKGEPLPALEGIETNERLGN